MLGSYSSDIPGHVPSGRNGIRKENQHLADDVLAYQQSIDEDFLATFDIPLVAGRSLTSADAYSYLNVYLLTRDFQDANLFKKIAKFRTI